MSGCFGYVYVISCCKSGKLTSTVSVTESGGLIDKVQAFRMEGREFESRPSQTKDFILVAT